MIDDQVQAATDIPANVEAEAALLGGLMINRDTIDFVADRLSPDDFHEPVHARIFEVIVRQHALGKSVTPVAIKGYFPEDPGLTALGGTAYLAQLTGNPMAALGARDFCAQVRDLADRRNIFLGLNSAVAACNDLDVSVGEIISMADGALATRGKDAIHQPSGGECLDELLAGYDQHDEGVRCHTIPELDNVLGPLKPKQLIIGAGRPGMGKSAMALSYSVGAARAGHGVLFVSLEMSSTELGSRIAADLCFEGESPVPFQAIQSGRLSMDQRRRIMEARDYMHTLPFRVVDAGGLTIGRLNMLVRRYARRMAAEWQKLELVVVDYLQLLSPDQRGRSNYEAVSEVSRGLKALAKDHGVAVLALAQLSREVEKRPDKRPQLADLRDSGQIEQDADAVLFLLREEYYLRKDEPAEGSPKRMEWEDALHAVQGEIEFIVAKRRNGVEGRATGRFYGAYQAVRGMQA